MPQNENMAATASNIRSTRPLKMPIGVSDFAKLIQDGHTFADKTLLIDDILLTGAEVTLIARPRRFGKTLNLSMLQHFLAGSVNGRSTGSLFDGLAIAGRPAAMAHQGQYPVIFLSLKDIKGSGFEKCEASLRTLLADLYRQYPELPTSTQLDPDSLKDIQAIRAKTATLADMANSVKLLSELLYKHHGRKVVILLDEYDTPIHAAYTHGFYPELVEFMRSLLGSALKDNPYLFKAVITGILRVSKESLFSGLNNIKVHTVLDEGYSAHFGFTETEVASLLAATDLAQREPALEAQIKNWYNGYRFGRQVIYNPWSIISCLDEKGRLESFWINTSGDDVLKKLMAQADVSFKRGLEQLIQGETVEVPIDPKLVFGDLDGSSTALWSLLLFSGYLTALAPPGSSPMQYELTIPNFEIRRFYEQTIRKWFTEPVDPAWYGRLLRSLASGEVMEFEAVLRNYLLRSASFFDAGGQDPEKFYHGLVLGMMVGLSESHAIFSNRESGYGRYDVALFPRTSAAGDLGVILEFKQTRDPAGLQVAAAAALAQIEARRYHTQLQQHPVKRILAIDMAFAGKEMALASRIGDEVGAALDSAPT